MPKKQYGAHILLLIFLDSLSANSTKLSCWRSVIQSRPPCTMSSITWGYWCHLFFGVLGLSSQPQALVFPELTSVRLLRITCDWSQEECRLGTSNIKEPEWLETFIQYHFNIPAPAAPVGQLDVHGLWMFNVFPSFLVVVYFFLVPRF